MMLRAMRAPGLDPGPPSTSGVRVVRGVELGEPGLEDTWWWSRTPERLAAPSPTVFLDLPGGPTKPSCSILGGAKAGCRERVLEILWKGLRSGGASS